jgi:hypothetical protein
MKRLKLGERIEARSLAAAAGNSSVCNWQQQQAIPLW